MTDDRPYRQHPGPLLLCAGTDPTAAARLAEVASVIVAGTTEDMAAHPRTIAGRLGRSPIARTDRCCSCPPAAPRPPMQSLRSSRTTARRPPPTLAAAAQILRPRRAVVASVWRTASYVVGVAMLTVPDEVVRKGAEGLDEAARLPAAGQASEAATQLTANGWSCEPAAIETSRNVPTAIVGAADEHDAGDHHHGHPRTLSRRRSAARLERRGNPALRRPSRPARPPGE